MKPVLDNPPNEPSQTRLRRPVIIFGAGKIGKLALSAMNGLTYTVVAFTDNDTRLAGMVIDGIPVISPQDTLSRFPDALYCLALYQTHAVIPQLRKMGILSRCLPLTFLEEAIMEGRVQTYSVLHETIRKTISTQRSIFEGMVSLGAAALIVTEACTLRCRDCSSRVPYTPKPRTWSTSELLEMVDRFLSAMDYVEELHLVGGDAFLHPNIHDLVKQLLSRPAIGKVMVFTNAIARFDTRKWEGFEEKSLSFHITDYGFSQQMIQNFIKKTRALGHPTYITQHESWGKVETGNSISSVDAQSRFALCRLGTCTSIHNFRVYRCQLVPFAVKQGLFPHDEMNYVELITTISPREKNSQKERLRAFLFNNPVMPACNHCSGLIPSMSVEVTPGIQLPATMG